MGGFRERIGGGLGRLRGRVRVRWRFNVSEEIRKDFKEGAFSLMLCNLGDYISGFFLQVFTPIISSARILMALLPAASDARGDVYSSYGSRLGTLLHLGLAKRLIKEELASLLTILIAINLWIGGLVTFSVWLVKGNEYLEPVTTTFTAVASALISALFMIPATTWLAFTAFKKGWDPDNLVAPIATLFGDIVTVPTLIASYKVAKGIPRPAEESVVAALIALAAGATAYIYVRFRRRGAWRRGWKVIKQNIPLIMLSTCFSTAAGIVLMVHLNEIIAGLGIMAVIPAFLEDGGAIACRFSARLSTNLHLGKIEARFIPRDSWVVKWVLTQFIVNMAHAVMIFGALGTFGYAMALWRGATPLWGLKVFTIVMIAGLILAVIVSILTYFMAIASFKMGIDPDNILAPFLTSVADIIGTSSLASMLIIFSHWMP